LFDVFSLKSVEMFNLLNSAIQTEILSEQSFYQRQKKFIYAVELMSELANLRNYHSLFSLNSAIHSQVRFFTFFHLFFGYFLVSYCACFLISCRRISWGWNICSPICQCNTLKCSLGARRFVLLVEAMKMHATWSKNACGMLLIRFLENEWTDEIWDNSSVWMMPLFISSRLFCFLSLSLSFCLSVFVVCLFVCFFFNFF
jgi:hypothetical protein